MIAFKRIAILGLYNSGSTVLAAMLHRMGVDMGAPFWMTSEEGHPENFYEPWDLSINLRRWWAEPLAQEKVPAEGRIRYLQTWIQTREATAGRPVGAKHPLLSLCATDLINAWGPDTCFIRARRPLEESIDGLRRRAWFTGYEIALQSRLLAALESFDQIGQPVVSMDWNRVKADPIAAAKQLAASLELNPTDSQIAAAAALVYTEPPQPDNFAGLAAA